MADSYSKKEKKNVFNEKKEKRITTKENHWKR